MRQVEIGAIDTVLDAIGSGGAASKPRVEDAKYVLEATFAELAPVIAIVKAHRAAIDDREDDIHFWVRVYMEIEKDRRAH